MRAIFTIFLLIASAVVLSAVEKETWYDASGKVVKVTRAEKSVERFVPVWERREASRQSDSRGRVQRTRSGYGYPPYYYGYGYRPTYRGYWGYAGHYRRNHPSFRIKKTYQKDGWSVRVKF